jgi:cell division protein FtsX
MAEENNNITQDKKIDKLQFQMENLQDDMKDLKTLSKETNIKLETMAKGFVDREEFKNFQTFIGTLATQKELADTNRRVENLESWNTWLARTIGGLIIAGVITASFLIK